MILTAFDVKFHEKKDGMPPEACRPLKNMKKTNVEKVGPQKVKKKTMSIKKVPRPSARPSGGSRGRSPRGRGKRGSDYRINCWSYIT